MSMLGGNDCLKDADTIDINIKIANGRCDS